jgi:S-adenosylmethionine uptake transporter
MTGRPIAFVQCLAGIAVLCLMDVVVKILGTAVPVPQIALARYAFGTLLALAVWQWQGRPPVTRSMLPVHLLRGCMIAAMSVSFYWSLTVLPLAECITLAFVAPLMVPPLAALFLGEAMQPRYLAAGALGFAGVLVTVQGAPEFDGDRLLGLAAVLFSAVTYAASAVVLRARAAHDGATVITLLAAAIPAILLSPLAIGAALPDWETLGWFVALGLIGNIGMQLLSRAYAHLEAQALAVMEFSALPWAALLGFAIFGEPVRPQIWAGAIVILAACLWATRAPAPGPAAAKA